MAITPADSATSTSASSASVDLTKPANVADGDVLIAEFSTQGASVNSVPTGWTLIGQSTGSTNPIVRAYRKTITSAAGEPATYSWGLSAANAWGGGIRRYTGVDLTNVLDVAAVVGGSAATAASGSLSITTVTNGAYIGCGGGANTSNANYSTPTNIAELWDVDGKHNTYGDIEQTTAGARTVTYTWVANRAWGMVIFALRPAAGGSQVSREWAVAYDILNQVSREWQLSYDILNQVSREWAVSYDILNQVSREWAVSYDILNQVSREWQLSYDILSASQVSREWAVSYDILNQVSREWAVSYDILNQASREWSLSYDILNQASREWSLSYDILNQASREWAILYDIGEVEAPSGDLMLLWLA